MDKKEQKEIMMHNLTEKSKAAARKTKEAVIYEEHGFTSIDAQLPSYNFNVVTLSEDTPLPQEEHVQKIIAMYENKGYPMNVWGWEDQPEITSMFKKAGLVEYETDYLGMIADLTAFHPGGPHKDSTMQFKKVTAPEQLITFGAILASLYEETEEEIQINHYFHRAAQHSFTDHKQSQHFLGYYQGKPVAIGSLLFTENTAGIHDIALLERERGRGLGTKLMYHLIESAIAAGAEYCTLQASPEAEGIYRKLGFETIGKLEVYANFK